MKIIINQNLISKDRFVILADGKEVLIAHKILVNDSSDKIVVIDEPVALDSLRKNPNKDLFFNIFNKWKEDIYG